MVDDVDRYLAGVPCWIDLAHADRSAAAAFYGSLFGWEYAEAADGLVARLDGREVAGIADGTAGAWTTSVRVDSADGAAASVRRAGGRVLADPADVAAAGRVATVADPSGAVLRLWQAGGRRGAETVNADGSWNWSNLLTDDEAMATEFYTAVFGWRLLRLGEGMAMWTLPGYSDVLAHVDPSLRDRHADEHVPTGFSDAVGWLLGAPLGVAPHWSVTFAVADTDKTVELAVSLGATVAVAPYSVPPVRAAELIDPQGAPFAVNTYRPEL